MVRKELYFAAWTLGALAVGWLFAGNARKGRIAKTISDEEAEFTPNKSAYLTWPLIVVGTAWVAVEEFIHNLRRPYWMVLAAYIGFIAIYFLLSFPAKIVISSNGLEEVYWLRRNKRIKWKDIVEINTGKKERMVTIVAKDGTKIVYSTRLPDRPRLLLELKRHCGENLPADFPVE